mmetsp:Transcript_20293/g.48313  ORF Transcript_20293/g.48313 Transcript_20293/m.48313 type:complete len:266 (-) Transcript_20293:263-1060(-)
MLWPELRRVEAGLVALASTKDRRPLLPRRLQQLRLQLQAALRLLLRPPLLLCTITTPRACSAASLPSVSRPSGSLLSGSLLSAWAWASAQWAWASRQLRRSLWRELRWLVWLATRSTAGLRTGGWASTTAFRSRSFRSRCTAILVARAPSSAPSPGWPRRATRTARAACPGSSPTLRSPFSARRATGSAPPSRPSSPPTLTRLRSFSARCRWQSAPRSSARPSTASTAWTGPTSARPRTASPASASPLLRLSPSSSLSRAASSLR